MERGGEFLIRRGVVYQTSLLKIQMEGPRLMSKDGRAGVVRSVDREEGGLAIGEWGVRGRSPRDRNRP